MSMGKAVTCALLAVLGWVLIFFTLSHWWALRTASGSTVGTIGLFAGEIVRTAPNLAYFFIVGLVFGVVMGTRLGTKLALFAASAAMCIYALLAQQIFYDG